jgi:hypothetical protein
MIVIIVVGRGTLSFTFIRLCLELGDKHRNTITFSTRHDTCPLFPWPIKVLASLRAKNIHRDISASTRFDFLS